MNFIDKDLSTTMLKGKAIREIEVTTSSYRVGDQAGHTFTFKTVVPLVPTDKFLIMYPPETSPPINSPECYGADALSKLQTCSVVQNTIKTSNMRFNSASQLSLET